MYKKIEIYFSKMFSSIILKNNIVATILYVVKENLIIFKDKLDKTLNTDI